MKKTGRVIFRVFLPAIIFLLPVSAGAYDFGLLLDQSAGAGGTEKTAFDYQAGIIPRFSFLLGDSGEFIVSAGITLGIAEEFHYIPELLRTEFAWRFNKVKVSAGRIQYSAPFEYIAEGLFDGFELLYDSPAGTFNMGTWYTGLLYKKNASITMTGEDARSYYSAVDYGNFLDTYFASRRLAAVLGWEHPALAETIRTKLAVIVQMDLNGRDEYLHSEYLCAKIGMPVNQFMFELSGALEIMQTNDGFNTGLAGGLGFFWTLPTLFPSRLSFTGFFSGGKAENGSAAAFTPLTAKSLGSVLQAKSPGISALSLDYTARLYKTFSLSLASSFLLRSDLGTYTDYPVDLENSEGYILGNEFFANLLWAPVSDLRLNLGSGIFLPSMGNAAPGRKPKWRIELAALLALY